MLSCLKYPDTIFPSSILRVSTGRSAIHHLVQTVKPTAVVLPAYVPAGVWDPIRAAGIEIFWYELRADLTPDPEDFRTALHFAGAKPLAVVIHYFGWPTPIEDLRNDTHEAGGILFEDGAHCVPGTVIEPISDVFLWSLNKIIPVVDGAIMVSQREDVDIHKPILAQPIGNGFNDYAEHLRHNDTLARRNPSDATKDGPAWKAALRASDEAYGRYYAAICGDFTLRRPYHMTERALAVTNWETVIRRRRENAAIISAHLGRYQHRPWDRSAIPFAFPVLVPKGKSPVFVAENLARHGIIAGTCARLWNVLGAAAGTGHAVDFYQRHILLPVNEGISTKQTAAMAITVGEVLR